MPTTLLRLYTLFTYFKELVILRDYEHFRLALMVRTRYIGFLIVKPFFNEDTFNVLIGRATSTHLMKHSQTCSKFT